MSNVRPLRSGVTCLLLALFCQSAAIVEGRILANEDGHAEKFFPSGLRLLTLKRSVPLRGRQAFNACTQCGHVWSALDASSLRELIEHSATDDLKRKLEVDSSWRERKQEGER
jgi:hypothetical protein